MTQTQTVTVVQDLPTALAPVSIKETVLAQFKEAEATITTLAEKYLNVAYDVATPKGMREAIAARADLRDNGRLFVTKAESRVKTEVNDLKRIMADEVTRLVAIVKPVEDSIDLQIKAEETRKAEEKAKRDREEAARISAHRANIEKIKGYVALAQGHSIEVIDHAAETLFDMHFGPEWEEFATEAAAARDAAVDSLNKLIASERQRLENERLQKELEDAIAALAVIAEEKEKARREASEKIAAEQAAAAKLASEQAAFEKLERDETARLAKLNSAMVVEAAPVVPVSTVVPMPVRAPVAPAAPASPPTLRLGQINDRLSPIQITADGLRALGFEPAATDRASKLYHESSFTHMCAALVKHINGIQATQAA